MSVASPSKTLTVALVGNPNTGKSTLFSALAGVRQRVGNYPGVTVEKKLGTAEFHGQAFTIVDLPGTYSLSPRSPDEMVAVDVLLGRQVDAPAIDVVLCIVDASNLERNFYLVSQVLELGLPTVIALNMVDVAKSKGLELDFAKLGERLPVKCVRVQANKAVGIAELKQAIVSAAGEAKCASRPSPFPTQFTAEVAALRSRVCSSAECQLPRYLVERLLLDTSGYLAKAGLNGVDEELLAEVQAARGRLAEAGLPVPAVESIARYGWATQTLEGVVTRPSKRPVTVSDRIDGWLTHRFFGTVVFIAVMLMMFQAVFLVAGPASALIDWVNSALAEAVTRVMPEGAMRSLITTGVIGGVGGVLVFVPQIFTLFFFIAVLEDCGYMARAAYLMDKLMSRIGLSGKSFIPLLSSFACAVPGIMATRVIENRRDRLVTILVAPLMSCSARLPVYTLLIGAFVPTWTLSLGAIEIPWLQGVVMFAMYAVGTIAGIAAAFVLKRTILRGPTPPFVMELPSYKMPGVRIVLMRMLEQGWSFVYRAGTLIFCVSILVWGLCYFPHDRSQIDSRLLERRTELVRLTAAPTRRADDPAWTPGLNDEAELAEVENEIEGQYLATSFLGRAGKLIEPVVRPLGWDWRIGCAAIASFPAREVVVATLGVIYNLGEGQDEASADLRERLKSATWDGTNRKVFNLPVALSIMVFFALCAQCASTLAVIRRETGNWWWPAFTFVYMTLLAYVGALLTYQIGMRL
ncbi:MAG TPA: ferrous iron transport protein B [Pirellulaceae bacterium]|jgi:ferrous iron transport protein B